MEDDCSSSAKGSFKLVRYSYICENAGTTGQSVQTSQELVVAFEVGHLYALMQTREDAVTGGYPGEVQQIDGLKKVGLPYIVCCYDKQVLHRTETLTKT